MTGAIERSRAGSDSGGSPEVRPPFSSVYAHSWNMPSTACHTTVDIPSLGFDTPRAGTAEVTIATTGEDILVEVAHADDVWSLIFDKHGELDDGPTQSAPEWLGPVITQAAPQLQVA